MTTPTQPSPEESKAREILDRLFLDNNWESASIAIASALRTAAGVREADARPKRAYTVDIHIGGDTWKDVMTDINHIAYEFEARGDEYQSVMGGSSSGHIVTVTHRPEMTHEKYVAELDVYLRSRQAAEQKGEGK